jgi:TRAP-type C4-dicarboxylate transport system substrate-binding protein
MAPGGPADQAVKRFAELVLERSDSRIVVNDFPGGSLGGEREILKGLIRATLPFLLPLLLVLLLITLFPSLATYIPYQLGLGR